MAEEYVKPKLSPVDSEFGSGMFVNWADKEEKTVVLTNFGQYEKEVKDGKEIKVKTAFHADVLKVNDKEFAIGEKVLDTTSIIFMKALKPFILNAQENEKKAICLTISRAGEANDTTYFIKEVTTKKGK